MLDFYNTKTEKITAQCGQPRKQEDNTDLFDEKSRPLCVLLGDLFHFNSLCKLFAKCQVSLNINVTYLIPEIYNNIIYKLVMRPVRFKTEKPNRSWKKLNRLFWKPEKNRFLGKNRPKMYDFFIFLFLVLNFGWYEQKPFFNRLSLF